MLFSAPLHNLISNSLHLRLEFLSKLIQLIRRQAVADKMLFERIHFRHSLILSLNKLIKLGRVKFINSCIHQMLFEISHIGIIGTLDVAVFLCVFLVNLLFLYFVGVSAQLL